MLFQVGYLTIKDFDLHGQRYALDFPNQEIRSAFFKYLISFFANKNTYETDQKIGECRDALENNDIKTFCMILQNIFAGIPYAIQEKSTEADCHRLLYLFVYLVGMRAHSEVMMSTGRIDMVIETRMRTTILELKFNKSAQEALNQIKEKRYYEKYSACNKPITLVGLSFNLDEKELTLDWVQENQ